MELRDYQRECVGVLSNLDGGSHLVQMATGLGKTVTFASIPRRGRVLLLSHRDELVAQPVRYYDCPVGIEKGPQRSAGEEVVSASVQTLSRGTRLRDTFSPGEFDLIITDEAHHAIAPSYRKIYDFLRPKLHIGFTATPNRGDDRGLDSVFDDIVFERGLRWGIANGWLVDIDCRRVYVDWVTRGVRARMGDFSLADLAREVDRPGTNEQVAAAYRELHIGQTLVFASSVEHARHLSELIPGSVVVDGKTPLEDRRGIIRSFTDREIPCIVNFGVFTEGTDLPLVETVLLARPTRNAALYTQMVGRGLRRWKGPDGTEKGPLRLIECMGGPGDKALCTAPSLFGLNEEDFPAPRRRRSLVDGLLSGLEERVLEEDDTPSGWILKAKRVDALGGPIAWVPRIDGGKMVSGPGWSLVETARDLVGHVKLVLKAEGCDSVQDFENSVAADDAALGILKSTKGPMDCTELWDSNKVLAWGSGMASARQVDYIRSLLGDEALDIDIDSLSKREASVVIEAAKARTRAESIELYGSCPVCGEPMRPSASGKTLQCGSNRYGRRKGERYALTGGCGFQVYAEVAGFEITPACFRELAERGVTEIGGVHYVVGEADERGFRGIVPTPAV